MDLLPRMALEAVPARHLEGYRRLAQEVILMAVKDRRRPGMHGDTARAFFADRDTLMFWCEVAGLDASRVA